MWLFMQAFADGLGVSLNSNTIYLCISFFTAIRGLGEGCFLLRWIPSLQNQLITYADTMRNKTCKYHITKMLQGVMPRR